MTVIKLPSVLPGNLNLDAINQQLRARTAQLDWSAVTSAPESALTVLLAGLDISNDADILGIDGAIAGTVIDQILAFDQQRPSQPAPRASPAAAQPGSRLGCGKHLQKALPTNRSRRMYQKKTPPMVLMKMTKPPRSVPNQKSITSSSKLPPLKFAES